MPEKEPKEKRKPNPFPSRRIKVESLALGVDVDLHSPKDIGIIVNGFSEGLRVPALKAPLQELLKKGAKISGLYAIALGIDTSSPSGKPSLDITYFAKLKENDSEGTFKAIQDAEDPLKDAEFPENWQELHQDSRGIGGLLTTASFFISCKAATFDRAVERFKTGMAREYFPMHLKPLQAVVVLRVGVASFLPPR